MKITTIDGPACDAIRKRLDELLAPLGEEMGVVPELGRMTFHHDGSHLTVKLTVAVTNPDGKVMSQARLDFARYAKFDKSLDAKWLDATFQAQGKTFTVVGYRPRAPKRPIECLCADGKTYRFPTEAVARHMGAS